MTVTVQKAWYTRQQLRNQPGDLFVWGDNLARFGGANNPKSGQAYACRGEPNAVGIPTKRLPSMEDHAFFRDGDLDEVRAEIDRGFSRMFAHVRDGGTVIWPADGIGTGRAKLRQSAPAIWDYIERRRAQLFAMGTVTTL